MYSIDNVRQTTVKTAIILISYIAMHICDNKKITNQTNKVCKSKYSIFTYKEPRYK